MSTDKIAALRRTALFNGLDEDALRALAERAIERRFQKDELLFVAGEEARGLYVIVEGAVRAFRESADGREQVIHVERAGATFAEVPVFDDGAFPSTVAAETDSVLLFIDKRDVRSLCLAHPQIALAALKVLAGRLRRCAELVETLSLREVGQRLARFLLAEARSRGLRTGGGFEVTLTVTNQQIAARVGSVREVVSRALTRLQQDGLVALKGRRLSIPNEESLATYAGEEKGTSHS
jgi:CRP/FNR family transcriptional regulator